MADEQSLNATFFALRKRENGGVLLGASIAYAMSMILLVAVVGAAAWFALGGGDFLNWYSQVIQMAASGETAAPPPPPNAGGMFFIFPLYFIYLFLVFVLLAAFESTCLRWMVRAERSGPLFLHFGPDMWRVYATYWVWFLYMIVGWIGFVVLMTAAGFVLGNAGAAGGWITFALVVAYLIGWIFVTVRLAPAAATSIGIGKFAPLKAWDATSGRFWALFGAYLLIGVIFMVAYSIAASVTLGAFYAQIFGGLDWTLAQSDPEAFAAAYEQSAMQALQNLFASPGSIAMLIAGQIVLYVVILYFWVLLFGVAARAVQAALEENKIEPARA